MEPFDPMRFRRGMTVEELMPDPDRRDVALGGLAIVVEHADEIYPNHTAPGAVLLPGRPRWADVLQEISEGHSREEAAKRLYITLETVKSHLRNAARALGTKSVTHAVAEAMRKGLIE